MADKRTSWILELVDRVTGPLKKIADSATPAVSKIAGLSRHLDAAEQRSGALTKKLGKLTVAAGAFAALSYGSLQFEERMAVANTMAQKGQVEFTALTDDIRNMSEEISVARDMLADGLYATISAGVPENNWIQFLNDSAKAAKGGQAELGTVIDATATIIKNYGEQWDAAGKIQDKFQKTVMLGQIPSLEALASALPRAAVLAAQLNVSQNELLSTFATASGPMGSVAEVSTQVSAALAAMLKPTSEAVDVAKRLGVEFNAQAISKAGGLRNFIDKLMNTVEAYSKRTGASQEELIGKLFGSQEAIKFVMGMGGQLSESWAENTNKVADSAGSVQAAFDIMNTTTTAKLQMMRNTFGNSMDEMLVILLPFVTGIIDGTKEFLQFAQAFAEGNPTLTKFIVLGGAAVFALTGLSYIIQLTAVRFRILRLQMLITYNKFPLFISRIKAAGIATLNFSKNLLITGWNAIKAGARFIWTSVTAIPGLIGSFVAATAAQIGLNVAMDANPIGLIVLGIAALIGVVTVVVKKYDEWGAALTLVMGPLGMIINLIMSFKRHWDSIVEAFQSEGIIGGLKRIGIVVLDALLMPLQQLLEIASKIPGIGDLAAKGAEKIADIRKNLELSGGELNVNHKKENSGDELPDVDVDSLIQQAGGSEKVEMPKFNKVLKPEGTSSNTTNHVKQEVTFNLTFTLPESWRNEIDNITDEVVNKLTGASKDAGGSLVS